MAKTQLKKLIVEKFRALHNVEIDFASHVTVICGKNGTSKSTILGIAAQIFSFEKDYVKNDILSFQTIAGDSFKSTPSEHFRFSEKFDIPGSLNVKVELKDGYTNSDATAELELTSREGKWRPVVRKNSVATGNKSRNFTHPVIFLSLKRLQPIATREYTISDFSYLQKNKKKFIALHNELLNKQSSDATGTDGSIGSAVAYSAAYDQDSVSAGEDNCGQIILALMSFRKLKDEYENYQGGLLLLDEADAGLFPMAQLKLLEILERECSDLKLQVVMTSHSPTLVQRTHELSAKYGTKFKTVYLTDTYGSVEAKNDLSWLDIYADMHTQTLSANADVKLPKVNVYFEDNEAVEMFKRIMLRHPANKFLNILDGVSLSCTQYVQLVCRGIPEFSKKSLIVLDADVKDTGKLKPIVLLPGKLPPDQAIFEYLYNLPPNNTIWTNSIGFSRSVFTKVAAKVIGQLEITSVSVDLSERLATYRENPDAKKKARELFKAMYKDPEFQQFLKLKGSANPWKLWEVAHASECNGFRSAFIEQLERVLINEYGVDAQKASLVRKP